MTSKIRGRLRDLCLGVGWRQIQFSTVEMFCTFHDSHKNHKPKGEKYYAGTYFRRKDQLGMKSDLTFGQKLVDPLSIIFHHLVFVLQELNQYLQIIIFKFKFVYLNLQINMHSNTSQKSL